MRVADREERLRAGRAGQGIQARERRIPFVLRAACSSLVNQENWIERPSGLQSAALSRSSSVCLLTDRCFLKLWEQ
ncbi:unnamed protein product [Sphagnum balticum]